MSLSLKKCGRVWHVEGRVNGLRVHQSLRTRDMTAARALLRDLETRLLTGGRLGTKAWSEFADEFMGWIKHQVKGGEDGEESTLSRYEFVVRRFSRFLREQSIIEVAHVDAAALAKYSEDRLRDVHPKTKKPATVKTVKSDLRTLHRIFSYAVECGYIAKNPVLWKGLGSHGANTQPFSGDEVATMLRDHIVVKQPMLRAVVLCFLFTGLRISDVVGLKREVLDINGGRLITVTKKRGKRVSLALHPELVAALQIHRACLTQAQRESAYVFSKPDGRPLKRTGLTATLLRLFARCGIKGGHPHRFRDTFAVNLLAQGASLYDVAKLLAINVATAEAYYSPYCKELQDRGTRLVFGIRSPVSQENSEATPEGKVVTFQSPLSSTLGHFGDEKAKEDKPAAKAKP